MIIRTTAAATAAAALAAVALAAPAAQAAPKRSALYASVLSAPAPVMGSDGRRHLAYEITLGSDGGASVDVESLAVRTKGGRTLQRLGAAELPSVMWNFDRRPTRTIGPTEGGRMWLDVTLPRRAAIPRALVHRFTVRATFADGTSEGLTFIAARTRVRTQRAIRIAPPLRGGPYLNFNGCCVLSPHRSAVTAMDGEAFASERYAADLIKIDAQGTPGTGDLTRNEGFLMFGQPVLAVADAKVVSTLETVPENVPFNEPSARSFSERAILGNHVILKLGPRRYAFYGHLQTGGVRVKVGQRVRTGQVLALAGNTGPSGAPHLHFGLTDRPQALASDSVPFVFDRFRLAGVITNLDQVLTGQAAADVRPAQGSGRRTGQMPLHGDVVGFGR